MLTLVSRFFCRSQEPLNAWKNMKNRFRGRSNLGFHELWFCWDRLGFLVANDTITDIWMFLFVHRFNRESFVWLRDCCFMFFFHFTFCVHELCFALASILMASHKWNNWENRHTTQNMNGCDTIRSVVDAFLNSYGTAQHIPLDSNESPSLCK